MADPVIADHYRAMVVFQGYSNLPEDRFVNTFTFHGGTDVPGHQAAHGAIHNQLVAFYNGNAAIGVNLRSFLTGYVSAEIRTYALGQAPPREPVVSTLDWATSVPSSNVLPAEVACVASFRGQFAGPRNRGRIYVGPLLTSAVRYVDGTARVATNLIAVLNDRMEDLANSSENTNWVILSRVSGTSTAVVGGWVDDAFDTQRRRGHKATARTVWGWQGPTPLADQPGVVM